jgi:hypothetical protein
VPASAVAQKLLACSRLTSFVSRSFLGAACRLQLPPRPSEARSATLHRRRSKVVSHPRSLSCKRVSTQPKPAAEWQMPLCVVGVPFPRPAWLRQQRCERIMPGGGEGSKKWSWRRLRARAPAVGRQRCLRAVLEPHKSPRLPESMAAPKVI